MTGCVQCLVSRSRSVPWRRGYGGEVEYEASLWKTGWRECSVEGGWMYVVISHEEGTMWPAIVGNSGRIDCSDC